MTVDTFTVLVDYVQQIPTRVGPVTHVIGTLIQGSVFPAGTSVIIDAGRGDRAGAVLHGIDMSTARPKVGLHFQGIEPSAFPVGLLVIVSSPVES